MQIGKAMLLLCVTLLVNVINGTTGMLCIVDYSLVRVYCTDKILFCIGYIDIMKSLKHMLVSQTQSFTVRRLPL